MQSLIILACPFLAGLLLVLDALCPLSAYVVLAVLGLALAATAGWATWDELKKLKAV